MKKPTMTRKRLAAILTEHAIDQTFWPELYLLVMHGVRPGDELLRRLRNVTSYVRCYHAILAELSKPVLRKHEVPPQGWQPPCRKAS